MFEPQGEGFHWTFNPFSKGRLKGRLQSVKIGYYVIEHVATGKLMTYSSKNVSESVDLELGFLFDDKHSCRSFCKLLQGDSELRVYEYPTASIKDAKRRLKSLEESISPSYLFMNP